MNIKRRNFLKLATTTAVFPTSIFLDFNELENHENELLQLSRKLLYEWSDTLLSLQIKGKKQRNLNGGILCPACSCVHGRIADLVHPFLFLANETNDEKYIEAAVNVFTWAENSVSMPDGSWANDVSNGEWRGITVFGATALAEGLINYGDLLDRKTKESWDNRLRRATEFVYKVFHIDYGNINYPAAATYCLSLAGDYLGESKYKKRGQELAKECLRYFTEENRFLFGEGSPHREQSKKGCYPVDLGYNIEESLPALTLYGLKENDEELLKVVTASLKTHMEFMLPDGGWDNSWGTRNYKWTYWGSRTTDGCQPAFSLLAKREPSFHKVALTNTKLLKTYTEGGILQGGLHLHAHGMSPCIHHTFSHCKALATVLEHKQQIEKIKIDTSISLPREGKYGVKEFGDIQTWLISKGSWRGTITCYDREYKSNRNNGHATGGALSLLWHEKTGPLITASMSEYIRFESNNMQRDRDPFTISLTPRVELTENSTKYSNVKCLDVEIEWEKLENTIGFTAHTWCVDGKQNHPESGKIACKVMYTFSNEEVIIRVKANPEGEQQSLQFILPVISRVDEEVQIISDKKVIIHKPEQKVEVSSNKNIETLPTKNGRVFNFVPGFQAIPFVGRIDNGELYEIRISLQA